jgi:hypothetical protein
MWRLRRWQRKCGFSAGSWQIQKTTWRRLLMWKLLGETDATFCSSWVQRMVSLITYRHNTFTVRLLINRLTLPHQVFVGYQKKWISLLHCCILHGPSGEHIVDVVPGGTELEPQDKMGSLGKLQTLVIIPTSSVWSSSFIQTLSSPFWEALLTQT